jgi:hypothetical protein
MGVDMSHKYKPGDLLQEKETGKVYRVLGARDTNLWLIWVDPADSVELTIKTRVGWAHDFTRYTRPLQVGDLVAYRIFSDDKFKVIAINDGCAWIKNANYPASRGGHVARLHDLTRIEEANDD